MDVGFIGTKTNELSMKKNKILVGMVIIAATLTACENQDIDFPDFDYQTVYFGNQYPVRTVELGEDLFVDTSIDNQHKVVIKATVGGVYKNNKDIVVDFKVDKSLCDGLYFKEEKGNDVKVEPMPSEYYQLASDRIVIPSGSILGGVEVQLTDAFFEDEKALSKNYVIPLLMTDVQGVDSILRGAPLVENPNRCISDDWTVKPKDYILYAVKYVNPWHGNYLRRGVDKITKEDGVVSTSVRHEQYVEKDEVVSISTNKLKVSTLSLNIYDTEGTAVNYNLVLKFAEDNTCTVSGDSDEYEISGTGKFVSKGDKNSMGGKDRDVLYLDYNVTFKDLNWQYATKDTLVVRDRGVAPEYFDVVKK